MSRCTARDKRGQQCDEHGAHDEVINSSGQRATVHYTKASLWTVPVSGLAVATAFRPDPMMLGAMLDRARTRVVDDEQVNSEEEMLSALRLGYMRGVEGNGRGENTLGFTLWPNGARAFEAGYQHAQGETVGRIISDHRS